MYQTYLIDIDNTILDFDAAEERSFQNVIESYCLPFERSMLDEYKKINNNLWNLLEQEKISREEVFHTRFSLYFQTLKKEVDGIEAESRYRSFLGNSPELIPHAEDTLLQLKSMGKKLYTASNGVYSTQITRLKQAGIYDLFDGMFISEKVGNEKPSYHFFRHCFDHIPDFRQEETIMVGDSLSSDIQGAVNAGIDSCLFIRTDSSVESAATHTIHDLTQLLSL
ncbi:noncanonical pyrimidine nucleotidase, YjjG family [Lacrimispora amygdalina]|uniref:Noncanonical pyrimidine nucleotidase, YjjG family n=1 Tax=Lacrimispora amygdalina TaxID=253257 RepID=A0A3E2NAE6_9FIRM|nr:YjjG family noncanonical pyrimidine nucleotidase [Clostridium indicum]RFZ77851.1 noncanonical pyrimidine nucleotidase, YjjG family [Clostridium indicum]